MIWKNRWNKDTMIIRPFLHRSLILFPWFFINHIMSYHIRELCPEVMTDLYYTQVIHFLSRKIFSQNYVFAIVSIFHLSFQLWIILVNCSQFSTKVVKIRYFRSTFQNIYNFYCDFYKHVIFASEKILKLCLQISIACYTRKNMMIKSVLSNSMIM